MCRIQRVAIRKQFFLHSLTVTRMEHSWASAGIAITFVSPLNAPAPRDQPNSIQLIPDHADLDPPNADMFLATKDSLKVYLEIQSAVPLLFAREHMAYTSAANTYIVQVCSCTRTGRRFGHHLA